MHPGNPQCAGFIPAAGNAGAENRSRRMTEDISAILRNWPYQPQHSIRKVIDADGGEKIQVRVDQGAFQGILQMELDGRPDGNRPHEKTFALEFYQETLRGHVSERGDDSGFALEHNACEEIFDESRRIYERYVFLLQIQDYPRVVRDTERNMEIFRFVNRYAENPDDRKNLERWWPYILRIHAVARVMIATRDQDYETAFRIVREAREKIEALEDVDAEEFHAEKKRSLAALGELAEELTQKKPLSPSERLRRELARAVENEDFEKAAEIRDHIRALEG